MTRTLTEMLSDLRLVEGHGQLAAHWAKEAHPRDDKGRFIGVAGAKVDIGETDIGDPNTPAAKKAKENINDVLGDKGDKYETGEDEDGNVVGKHEDVDTPFPLGPTLTSTVAGLVGFFDIVSGLAVSGIGATGSLLARAASDLEEGLRGIGAL
jgi:hypothetical protein